MNMRQCASIVPACCAGLAQTQAYPAAAPIRLIVPWPPMGSKAMELSRRRSAAMMLRQSFALPDAAGRIHRAFSSVLAVGYRTADIFQPGTNRVGTVEMGNAVAGALRAA